MGRARAHRERGVGTPDRRAKLSVAEVQAIRRRYGAGGVTQRMLAALYGISPVTICLRGRARAHLAHDVGIVARAWPTTSHSAILRTVGPRVAARWPGPPSEEVVGLIVELPSVQE